MPQVFTVGCYVLRNPNTPENFSGAKSLGEILSLEPPHVGERVDVHFRKVPHEFLFYTLSDVNGWYQIRSVFKNHVVGPDEPNYIAGVVRMAP